MTLAVFDEMHDVDDEFWEQEFLTGRFVDTAEDHAWLGALGESYQRQHLDG